MPTTKSVELIRKKEFIAVDLALKDKTFVIYVVSIASLDLMYLLCKT